LEIEGDGTGASDVSNDSVKAVEDRGGDPSDRPKGVGAAIAESSLSGGIIVGPVYENLAVLWR
jgi:hypothetical protein